MRWPRRTKRNDHGHYEAYADAVAAPILAKYGLDIGDVTDKVYDKVYGQVSGRVIGQVGDVISHKEYHRRLEAATVGATRSCPDCGRPQHYTGHENGWAHDALIDTWECADPAAYGNA